MNSSDILRQTENYHAYIAAQHNLLRTPASPMLKYNVTSTSKQAIWEDVTPLQFVHLEPIASQNDVFELYIEGGHCHITKQIIEVFYPSYLDIYTRMAEIFKSCELGTRSAGYAWTQHYHLEHKIFTPSEDNLKWNAYAADEYIAKNGRSSYHIVLTEALENLFPKAKDVLLHIHGLGLSTRDARNMIEQTCVYARTPVSPSLTQAVCIPDNVST